MIRLKVREEGSACLGRRLCVTVPPAERSLNSLRYNRLRRLKRLPGWRGTVAPVGPRKPPEWQALPDLAVGRDIC